MLQDNAEKMKHNDAVERRRVEKLVTEDGPGKFRPPLLPRQHNFENRVGVRRFGPTRQVAGVGSGWVRDTRGKEFPHQAGAAGPAVKKKIRLSACAPQSTSRRSKAVARESPTKRCLRVKCGLLVSTMRTLPGSVSPWQPASVRP